MQERFIEVTKTETGNPLTLNVAHITAIGQEKVATRYEAGEPTEWRNKTWVSTSARQVWDVRESYEELSALVRGHL